MAINYNSNDVNTSGILTAVSGVFLNSITINGSGVGTVRDIVQGTNITVTSTSGIYTINSTAGGGSGGGVVVENSGNDRILTSTGSSSGINAEANLTFNGSLFTVTGSGNFASGLIINNQTANTIASFDANKNVTSLSTGTYPSLTELSYVKGVTSAIQTQINTKQNTLTNPVTGVGVSGYVSRWTSSSGVGSGILYDDGVRVGIGTITPTGNLHVIGTGIFSSSLSVGSTASPRTVYISGASAAQGEVLRIQNGSSTNNCYLDVGVGTPGNYDDHVIFFRGSGTGANARIFGVDSTNRFLSFVNLAMFTNTNITSYSDGNAIIKLQSSPANEMQISSISGIVFQNKLITRMKMDSDGKFGIGTTTPTAQLHVNGSGFIASGLTVSGLLTVNGTGVSISGHTHSASEVGAISGVGASGYLSRWTTNSGLSTGILYDNLSGIGIRTISPTAQLHVNGSGYFASGCSVSGILNVQVIKQTVASGTDGATVTFDMNTANVHTVRLGGNRTLAVTNVDIGQRFTIRLKQDTSPPRTVTWFSGIYWPSNKPPILTRSANAVDVFSFICTASGKYDGYIVGYNFPNA